MSYKKMGIIVLSVTFCALICIGAVTVVLDPYFHYHKPFDFQSYSLHNQRYQNDGIARHFEYDAIITGTSMTENFKTSEFDDMFSVKSIKIPYFGASFKEIDNAVSKAIGYNDDVKIVLRSIDHYKLFEDKDLMSYTDYPEYLYDNTLFNDAKYVLNKDILFGDTYLTLMMTLSQTPYTTFDEYSNWDAASVYGKEEILKSYTRKEVSSTVNSLSEEDEEIIEGTVYQNFIETAKNHSDIDFYFFLPPYSMVYWDSLYTEGEIQRHLQAQKSAISMMLEYDNIHVYSFLTDYDTICNLDNYKDTVHYKEEINSKILAHMSKGEYKLTKENCGDYFDEVYSYYTTYDYNSLFE